VVTRSRGSAISSSKLHAREAPTLQHQLVAPMARPSRDTRPISPRPGSAISVRSDRRVNETFATLVCPLCLDDDCFATGSSVGFGWALGGNLPRRLASWTDVVMSRSSSVSVRYLTALGRSLGRTWRCVALSAGASLAEARLVGGEPSCTIWVEKRSISRPGVIPGRVGLG
jgi:hypothetical protein